MKPFSTGSEMKLARNPRRNMPAEQRQHPGGDGERGGEGGRVLRAAGGEVATAAADRAAVADIGPTIRCRELPNSA